MGFLRFVLSFSAEIQYQVAQKLSQSTYFLNKDIQYILGKHLVRLFTFSEKRGRLKQYVCMKKYNKFFLYSKCFICLKFSIVSLEFLLYRGLGLLFCLGYRNYNHVFGLIIWNLRKSLAAFLSPSSKYIVSLSVQIIRWHPKFLEESAFPIKLEMRE